MAPAYCHTHAAARPRPAGSGRTHLTRLSFTIGRAAQTAREQPDTGLPAAAPARTAVPAPASTPAPARSHRRLADAIDGAFRLALARGDLATAEELLGVLRGLKDRVRIRTPADRRRGDPLLERAQRELDARKAARYRRY